jgi:DUF4097 and DUF4098 domain-containing protein YvlB
LSVDFDVTVPSAAALQLKTNTGSIDVSGVSGQMTLSSNTGSLNTNFPGIVVQRHQVTGADAHGDVGGSPQATITLRTSTGSINLYQG